MTVEWQEQLRPGIALREIVEQATAALIAMDNERLEELAKCCADLNRQIEHGCEAAEAAFALREAGSDIQLLGRVLYETRANLTVLTRLHAMRLREAMSSLSTSSRGVQSSHRSQLPEMPMWSEKAVDYGDN